MAKNEADPDYPSYLGVRYVSPDFIRQLRFGLDLGVKPEVYTRKFKREIKKASDEEQRIMAEHALGALRYMLRNPLGGVVRWTQGEQYVWRDDEEDVNT
jgi:hypothetical protein